MSAYWLVVLSAVSLVVYLFRKPLIKYIKIIWAFFENNSKQIGAVSQVALVCGALAGLYGYFHDDRKRQMERVAKVSDIWINNADELKEIDGQWISRVHRIVNILYPPEEIPGLTAPGKHFY